jgi:hypothetical protein
MELIYRLRKNRLIIFGLKLINKMQPIVQWDRALLKHINAEWHNSFLDNLLPAVRNQDTWLPLYLFLILFVAFNYKKTRWWWIVFAISSVVITNFISSSCLKEFTCHKAVVLRLHMLPIILEWLCFFTLLLKSNLKHGRCYFLSGLLLSAMLKCILVYITQQIF